ncbi:dTMP kinase [bacterium]|nr:MAG: dTMP kinase [bacterium]
MKGIFITFEGIDGSGKSTQAKYLQTFLESNQIDVIMTREPGGTKVAEKIRQILLDKQNIELSGRAELLLYLASRAQHTVEIIEPALNDGKWVISDRFTDSSIAYQGCARGLGMEMTKKLSLFATGGIKPDLTFYLDISPQRASERLNIQGKTLDRLEVEQQEFYDMVRQGYKWIAEQEPHRFIQIPGDRPPQKVWESIKKELLDRFGQYVHPL